MHSYMYIHEYLHTCIPICIYIHSYLRTHVHTSIHAYVHTYIHTHIHNTYKTQVQIYIHTFLHIYIYTHVCVCANVCSEPKEEYLHVCEGPELSRLEDLSTVRFQDCKILGTGARCEGDLWNPNKYTVNQIQNQINKE